ncbi:MAG: RecX family transcriptional regulator [Candidatus Doudnabacteria bacterium]|nr:RecX family transcriptional regulator [Candidatus Doudnabacteria bacterium]
MNIYEKALSLLKIRPHHSAELTKKLLLRRFKKSEVEAVIGKLTQQKLLDNDQYAQTYLDNLIKYKTLGFYGLKAKLMQRGVAGQEAENLLKANFPPEKEREVALRLVERSGKMGKLKLAQKLARKGFRSEIIRSSFG